MKVIFFSDAHLDKNSDHRKKVVLSFLNNVCADADTVFILGDLFEFYHGYDGYIFPWYKDIADSLKNLTGKGISVYFIEGNHEFNMGGYFESYTGTRCTDSLTVRIDGKSMFFAHGHEIRKNYLVKALKTSFMSAVMDMFKPVLAWRVAAVAGIFLSKRKKPHDRRIVDVFRQYARSKFEEGYEAVVLAHSHISDSVEYTFADGKKYYLNTGDIIRESTYIEYNTGTGFEIKKHSHT